MPALKVLHDEAGLRRVAARGLGNTIQIAELLLANG